MARHLPKVITQSEAEALVAECNVDCSAGLRDRAMLEVMLGGGLRVSEVVGLLPRDVDFEQGEVRVNSGKGGKDRVIPVNDETLGWVQVQRSGKQKWVAAEALGWQGGSS